MPFPINYLSSQNYSHVRAIIYDLDRLGDMNLATSSFVKSYADTTSGSMDFITKLNMRITEELISKCEYYLNAVGEY